MALELLMIRRYGVWPALVAGEWRHRIWSFTLVASPGGILGLKVPSFGSKLVVCYLTDWPLAWVLQICCSMLDAVPSPSACAQRRPCDGGAIASSGGGRNRVRDRADGPISLGGRYKAALGTSLVFRGR
jgi:hypothetical protein